MQFGGHFIFNFSFQKPNQAYAAFWNSECEIVKHPWNTIINHPLTFIFDWCNTYWALEVVQKFSQLDHHIKFYFMPNTYMKASCSIFYGKITQVKQNLIQKLKNQIYKYGLLSFNGPCKPLHVTISSWLDSFFRLTEHRKICLIISYSVWADLNYHCHIYMFCRPG